MANITVSTSLSNVNVNTTSNVVTVTSTPSNVVVTSLTTANIAAVRASLSAVNVSGYGNLTYDSSNTSNGVFQYVGVSNSDIITVIDDNPANIRPAISVTDAGGDGSLSYSNTTGVITYTGPSAAEVRAHISNTSPIEYNASTGVISIDSNAVFSGKTTDDLAEGTTNLYFTSDRANSNVEAHFASGVSSNIQTSANLIGAGGTFTANVTIGGNLNVTGNINSSNVVDLFVEDRNITLQFGQTGSPTANSQIFVDRGTSANSYILWDEFADKWQFSNDGSTNYPLPTDTDDLSEGSTNLYYTEARANASIGAYTGNIQPGNINGVENIYGTGANGVIRISAKGTLSPLNPSILLDDANAQTTIYSNSDILLHASNVNTQSGSNLNVGGNITLDPNVGIYGTGAAGNVLFGSNVIIQGTNHNLTLDDGDIILSSGNINTGGGDINTANGSIDAGTGSIQGGSLNIISGATALSYTADGNGNVGGGGFFSASTGTGVGNTYVEANSLRVGLLDITGSTFANTHGTEEVSLIVGTSSNNNNDLVLGTQTHTDTMGGTSVERGNIWFTMGNIDQYAMKIGRQDGVTATGNITAGANINAAGGTLTGILTSNSNITTTANVAGSYFVGNVDATTVTATGNIDTTANINAAGGTLTGVLTSNSNIELTNDAIYIGDINGAIQQEVRNESGVTIARGKAVYLTGVATGDTPHVALANAEVSSQMPALGVVKNNIANASVGEVVISGQLNIGTHGFTIGSQLYINGAGDLTETIPLGEGNLVQKIGKVVTSQQIIVQGAGRTNATPNLDEGNIFLGGTSGTTISVTPDSNFDTLGNAFSLSNTLTDVNSITSESASALKLRGQTGGIELDKTVNSTDTTIVDIDTDGYTLADASMPADFTEGTSCPSIIVSINLVNGSNTATCNDFYGGALGSVDAAALRGPTYSSGFTSGNKDLILTVNDPTAGRANVEAALTTAGTAFAFIPANGVGNSGAGLYGQNKGWRVLNVGTGSSSDLFPLGTYVTDVTGNVITFSQNATASTQTVSIGLIPNMVQTSNANVQLKYQTRQSTAYGANSENAGFYGLLQTYDNPSTLANTTFDAISYGNTSSVTASTVNTKNIVDIDSGNESASRFTRGLLIGPSTTPDPFSGRTENNNPSALGVILENDGETFTGNNAPAAKFLINSYSGNLDDLTELPTWASIGGTGNLSLDLPQVKAPQLSLKAFRGAKSTANADSYTLQTGDVVGKVAFNLGQTSGLAAQGGDLVNPPAAITVDVGDANITHVANTYMHITTTPDPGTNLGYLRNNANVNSGANQQTNFTTKDGNVTIAAQTNGMITLAPTPDYGDSANATVWTRFPGSTHEYHTFLNASFGNISAKTGTLVEIQPKSGTTTGSGGLGYDSVGNATLRLTTHESNSVVKGFWDLEFDQSAQSLHLKKDGTEEVKFTADQTVFTNIPVMPSYSNTALPSSVAGGIIYITNGNNKPAYGDGTNWYYYDNTQVT